ncbi:MAG: hypothetical protein IKR90_02510 [Clostridia bacterium]|nr:hypothetical protein [Clostridia bacterium]
MNLDLISEKEASSLLALWLLDNDKSTCLPVNISRDEFAGDFAMPEIRYTYFDSFAGTGGGILSLFKGEIALPDWKSRSGKAVKATVYRICETFPETESAVKGYMIEI